VRTKHASSAGRRRLCASIWPMSTAEVCVFGAGSGQHANLRMESIITESDHCYGCMLCSDGRHRSAAPAQLRTVPIRWQYHWREHQQSLDLL